MPQDNDNTARDGPSASTFLDDIEAQSPFEPGGRLPRSTRALLLRLDPAPLGRAVTILLRHSAGLPPIDRAAAAETIDALVRGGHAELEIPALADLYRDLSGDRTRRALSALVIRLIRSTDPEAAARLEEELDGRTMAEPPAMGAAPEPTRGMDFPPAVVEPTAGAEPPPTAEPPPGDEPPPTAAPPPTAEPPPAAERQRTPSGRDAEPATPTAPPRTYRAYGLLESDETVLVGRPFELKVGLSPSSPPGVAGPPLELPKPGDGIDAYQLDIQLFADGFDLAPDESWRHSLPVSADDLYPSVVVHLTARDLPTPQAIRSITATFSIDGETLGAATRQIIVTTDPGAVEVEEPVTTATGTNITAPTGQPPADITITIKRGLDQGALQWSVESNLPGVGLPGDAPAESDIGDDPKEFATAIIRKLHIQGEKHGWAQLLQGIGKIIRDEMPASVRDAIRAANAAVTPRPLDILLLTEEAYIPWELAWVDEPFDPAAPHYLGAQANVGRWILDEGTTPTDPPRQVHASSMAVVWGVYTSPTLERLEAAEEEARIIQDRYKAASIDAQPDLVYPLLGGAPPSDILHFAVHGRYDPQGAGEGIYLVSGPPIDPFQIRGSDLSTRSPFVFLNACQVGAGQNLLGNYGGIAQAFLRIGASAVVAPLWSIDDTIAQKIALAFYHSALGGDDDATDNGADGDGRDHPAVADLLRRARAAAAQSPTYLAYQFYGHPSLRLTWNPAVAAGGPPHG